MNVKHLAFEHLLLYRCSRCKKALPISVMSEEGNLEGIDGNAFEVECSCGCSKHLLGVEAVRHWVIPWDDGQDVKALNGAANIQSPMMADCPTLHKFPEGSADCDYDVFEELGDGTTVWRACVVGMENVELKLRELARESNNKFFALNFQGGIQPEGCPLKSFARLDSYRAS
jgi:hypothetical protein